MTCGICEKNISDPLGNVMWHNPMSGTAHTSCYRKIAKSEKELNDCLIILFSKTKKLDDYARSYAAHSVCIKAVRSACGSETILSYLEKKGENALAHLFNTVGKETAKAELESQKKAKL